MSIMVNVVGQRMIMSPTFDNLVSGSQDFVKFKFNLSAEWDGLVTFAQFRQSGNAYNQLLDENNEAALPAEIGAGTCTMMLYGSGGTVKGTTNYLTLVIDESMLVQDAQSTEITQSLYDQLVAQIAAFSSFDGQRFVDLQNDVSTLKSQMTGKASSTALTQEVVRARAAENANALAIQGKASQADLEALQGQVTALQSNQAIASAIENAVQVELATYLNSGVLANMTITDGSISRGKVNSSFEATLVKADTAMQPSVYDTLGYGVDVYAYARARAAEVNTDLDTLEAEVWGARDAGGSHYTNLKAAIEGATTNANTYTDAALAGYRAFTITIVDELPQIGADRTFYLVPKDSGNGYDKYWYITDDLGDKHWDVFGASSTVVVDSLPLTGDVDVDYILNTGSGLLYYKWFSNAWHPVAGSMAYVAASLPSTSDANELTDYFIADSDSDRYIHYRYISGAFKVIGGDSYTKLQVNSMISNVQDGVTANAGNISSLSRTVDSLRSDVDNLDIEGYTYYHTITQDENTGNYVLTLYQVDGEDETIASQTVLPATGGGGSGGPTTLTTVTIDRTTLGTTPSPLVITTSQRAEIVVDITAEDSDSQPVDATYTWKLGSTVLLTGAIIQGRNTFDLTPYTTVGTQRFSLTVVDEFGTTAVRSWTVQMVDIRLESNFNDRATNPIGRNVQFTYTPYGSVVKTVHFKIDGVESTVSTSASGTLQTHQVNAMAHGPHLLEAWITATVNGSNIETDHIYKDLIWYNPDADGNGDYAAPVIGCIYRYDYRGAVSVRQYDTTPIVYNVYDPLTNYPTVKRYVDGVLVGTDTVSTAQNTWNFQSDDVGAHILKITTGDSSTSHYAEVEIRLTVVTLGIDVAPVSSGLALDFNPTGVTNSSSGRLWSNENYHMSVSNNFDWANGGYQIDENGDSYFLVKAGTRAAFDYEMFSGGLNANPSVYGAEMKIIFKTENVQDADAVWLTNVETREVEVDGGTQTIHMGLQMGVHEGWLKTNTASNTDVDGVAATNTYLYMPYSEEDIIEMDINIDPLDAEQAGSQAFVMAYEDGVPSKAFVYGGSDRFYQYTPQPLVIGSDYCDVRIYRLKMYSTSLTTEDIMRNFIADSRNSATMLARYDRNSIYYNRETQEYSPYSGQGVLDPERLAPIIPNVKVLMLETDHFTTSKKTFVKSTLRCIHATGGDLYAGDPYYDNWKFENGYHAGQGTTSDNYGASGRNVDFLFNCDGTHKPSDKVNAEADYISQVTLGYGTETRSTEAVTDWKGSAGKVALTRTSVPNNFFNLKVNIASSENVNNALLQKRYSDFLPYISPAKRRDPKVKNDMEFVPAVLFIKETNPDVTTHNEFLDTEWHFYALGNIGDSKKTDYTRAYDPTDMNEFTIEVSDNTPNNATFQTGVFLDGDNERQIEHFTLEESVVDGETVVTPVSVDSPSAFVYPITDAEWNDANNMRRWCLDNEPFDGDHSFEPRYACCGDYRDGKLVNDTTGTGRAQVAKNNAVWRAFYRWVITSTDAEFQAELDEWCVRSAVEFFYAFTHAYTMMDNRAKNTFWHFAKTGTYRAVTKPVAELLHVYCEADAEADDGYSPTEDTVIDANKTYYTQYAFDLWDYDNDRDCRCKTFSDIRQNSRDGQCRGKSSYDCLQRLSEKGSAVA